MGKSGRKPFGHNDYDQTIVNIIKLKRRARKRKDGKKELKETSFAQIARELEAEHYKTHTEVPWYGQLVSKILNRPDKEKKVEKKKKTKHRRLGSKDKMSIEQVEACRKVCPQKDRMIYEILVIVGLRATEICLLQVQDIAVYAGKSEIDIRGKGGEGKVTRTNEVSPELAADLREYLSSYRPDAGPEDAVFLNVWGRPLRYPPLLARIKSIGKKAKVFWLRPHKCRHTAATFLYNYTLDPFAVRDFLGHLSVKTTEIYTQSDEAKKKAHAAGLFAALNPNRNKQK